MPIIISFPQFAITDQDAKSIVAGIKVLDIVYVQGSEVKGPSAGATLMSYTVPQGFRAHVVAVEVLAGDANEFTLGWTSGGSARSKKIYVPTAGYYMVKFPLPPTLGAPADAGTAVTLSVVNAGLASSKYYAAMWIALA